MTFSSAQIFCPSVGTYTAQVKQPCRVLVISDDRVFPLYGETVKTSFENAGFTVSTYVFPHGEASKNLTTFGNILECAAGERLTRTDLIAALGGGVVGDVAGFAAACYLRGIDFVQIPTSLLAAVDSSVGGKTAVDLDAGKNLAGAFHEPIRVLCDTNVFATLDARERACGMGEVIKYGLMNDRAFFETLETGVPRCRRAGAPLREQQTADRRTRRIRTRRAKAAQSRPYVWPCRGKAQWLCTQSRRGGGNRYAHDLPRQRRDWTCRRAALRSVLTALLEKYGLADGVCHRAGRISRLCPRR